MSLAHKRKLALGAVLFVACWPLVHHLVVTRYHMNPWRFFGLSMYTQPRPVVKVAGVELGFRDRPLRAVAVELLDPRVQAAFSELAYRRAFYGDLARTTDLESAIFAALPGLDRVEVALEVLGLDEAGYRTAAYEHRSFTRGEEPDSSREGP